MIYFILAEICLTIGTPNWVVVLCSIFFGLDVACAIINILLIIYAKYIEKN